MKEHLNILNSSKCFVMVWYALHRIIKTNNVRTHIIKGVHNLESSFSETSNEMSLCDRKGCRESSESAEGGWDKKKRTIS